MLIAVYLSQQEFKKHVAGEPCKAELVPLTPHFMIRAFVSREELISYQEEGGRPTVSIAGGRHVTTTNSA